MTKSEILSILANTPNDELGDMLIDCMIEWWSDHGESDDEILFLVETVLSERNQDNVGD